MNKYSIDVEELRFFSPLMKDYLAQDSKVRHLYHRFPKLEEFKSQIAEKQDEWNGSALKRQVLSHVLLEQYKNVEDAEKSLNNIQLLEDQQTFTVTTGHQLNLFTGPLYFLYKIISTINLCKQLREAYPAYQFVPVYWMATEDHDFEEIQYFNYGNRKLVFNKDSVGAVGRLSTEGLENVFQVFEKLLGKSETADELRRLFKQAYLDHDLLSDATRFLAHQLFKDEGLVIIDADDPRLKALATDFFIDELQHQTSFNAVTETLNNWDESYKQQVVPREINLFYLTDTYRKRIIKEDDRYVIDGEEASFTESEIIQMVHHHPERFSPNVIMRPMYQELILPNLCYIGGGGEMAYWLELKNYFESSKVTFPILLLRNSVLLITAKQLDKVSRLNLDVSDLFKQPYELSNQIAEQVSDIDIDLSKQKDHLKTQFKELYDLARKTEKSFEGAVAAQEHKQIKGLEKLEKRLLKAQKRKHSDHIERAINLQKLLFPNSSLQERQLNFSVFYEIFGEILLRILKEQLDPLDPRFSVIELD